MASVAAKDVPALGASGTSPARTPSAASETPKQKLSAQKRGAKRPRTRSLALNLARNTISTPPNMSSRETRARNRHLREKSPVIDLTTDIDFEVPPANSSPLKNASRPARDLPTRSSRVSDGSEKSPDLKSIPNPRLHHEASSGNNELNLSPIKKGSPAKTKRASPRDLPRKAAVIPVFLSSPSKRRKTVAFSDNIISDVPSSPLHGESDYHTTPKRSILKQASETVDLSPLDPNNSTMWVKTSHTILHQFSTASHAPNNPEFWQPGTIIQLEPKSSDLVQLVDGCVEVLKVAGFRRKFEVYATLNQIFKLNDAVVLLELFSGGGLGSWLATVEKTTGYKRKSSTPCINELCLFVTRDIEATEESLFREEGNAKLSPSRRDPFKARTLSQALKFVSSMLSIPSINTLIPANSVKWFYSHTCEMIVRPALSKLLVLPYLSIIKDCPFSAKKRKIVFEISPNPILEQILFALLDIRSFVSSSLVNEKFIALKNLIQKFPGIMAKNFHHWFSCLVLNLCDILFPLYTKIAATGITALLEAARNYLDYPDICLTARKILESPLPSKEKSFTSENLISISTMPLTITIDYVCDSLQELIDNGHYKYAMDIWVGLTLLLGRFDSGIENWRYLQPWLQVHKYCFNGSSIYAKITALASWKAIVYKICICEFKEIRFPFANSLDSSKNTDNEGNISTPNGKRQPGLEEILRPKIKLLTHIFINISSVEFQREIIDTLHHCFLSILYNLMSLHLRSSSKMLLIYWDKIIQPVLMNFYFKKECLNSHMHHLGLNIFNRLVKPATPVTEKSYSTIRCLSNDAVGLSEINSVNPRWVYVRFERLFPVLLTIFKLTKLDTEAKMGSLNNFLNTLKFTTKKEVQPSDSTFDIIENLPMVLQCFFDHNKASYDLIFKMIVNLNDTFGASDLVLLTDESPGVFETILANSIETLNAQQLNAILSMLYGAIGERKSLVFISRLMNLNKKLNRQDLTQFVGECLSNKKALKFSYHDMITIGKIFQVLDQNFSAVAKKLIQHIVLLKAHEFERMVEELGIVHWNIQIFKFFVTLMHDAPFEHLKQSNLNLIKCKLLSEDCFEELFCFLLENRFEYEIFSLRKGIVEILKKSDPKLIDVWQEYLKSFEGDFKDLDELLCASIDMNLDIPSLASDQWDKLPLSRNAMKIKENPQSMAPVAPESTEKEVGQGKNDSEIEDHSLDNDTTGESAMEDDSISEDSTRIEDSLKQENGDEKAGNRNTDPAEPVIELSSEDNVEENSRPNEKTNHDVTSPEEDPKGRTQDNDMTEALISNDSEESEKSFESRDSHKRPLEQTIRDTHKRQKTEQGNDFERETKQISDSEESAESKSEKKQIDGNIEIDSSSGSIKRIDSDSMDSVGSLTNISQVLDTPMSKLSVVKELPTIEKLAGSASAISCRVGSTVFEELNEVLRSLSDEQLAGLLAQKRYELETLLMEFLLRVRHLGQNEMPQCITEKSQNEMPQCITKKSQSE